MTTRFTCPYCHTQGRERILTYKGTTYILCPDCHHTVEVKSAPKIPTDIQAKQQTVQEDSTSHC